MKKDSQGICFLGDVDMREFLAHYIEQKPGPVVTSDGEVIGEHDGIWFYTLGERHGFRVTKQSSDQKPYYIVGKNIVDNTLVVSHTSKIESKNKKQVITLRDERGLEKGSYDAQIRYHGELVPAKVTNSTTVELTYKGVVPLGQSLVLYKGDVLIGGGIIDQVE